MTIYNKPTPPGEKTQHHSGSFPLNIVPAVRPQKYQKKRFDSKSNNKVVGNKGHLFCSTAGMPWSLFRFVRSVVHYARPFIFIRRFFPTKGETHAHYWHPIWIVCMQVFPPLFLCEWKEEEETGGESEMAIMSVDR